MLPVKVINKEFYVDDRHDKHNKHDKRNMTETEQQFKMYRHKNCMHFSFLVAASLFLLHNVLGTWESVIHTIINT